MIKLGYSDDSVRLKFPHCLCLPLPAVLTLGSATASPCRGPASHPHIHSAETADITPPGLSSRNEESDDFAVRTTTEILNRMLALRCSLIRPTTRSLLPCLTRISKHSLLPVAYKSFSSTAMAATVHKVAQQGFGTGTNELYDR
jgi:hypothetical protein